MGKQQSFISFENKETLIDQLKKYEQRNSKADQTYVLSICEVQKNIMPFSPKELVVVIGGERYGQRNKQNLREETGITKVKEIAFIDCSLYCHIADEAYNGNLGAFLDDNFKALTTEEIEALLK